MIEIGDIVRKKNRTETGLVLQHYSRDSRFALIDWGYYPLEGPGAPLRETVAKGDLVPVPRTSASAARR
jgi:hypothetical protein